MEKQPKVVEFGKIVIKEKVNPTLTESEGYVESTPTAAKTDLKIYAYTKEKALATRSL